MRLKIFILAAHSVLLTAAAVTSCSELRYPLRRSDPVSCGASSCHEASPLGQFPPASGKHTVHLESHAEILCSDCHNSYNANRRHKNGVINGYDSAAQKEAEGGIVFFNASAEPAIFRNPDASWNNETGSCGGMNCHPDAKWYAEPGSYVSGCAFCHRPGSSIDPLTINGSGADGKHAVHLSGSGYACEKCHSGYKSEPTHINGQLDADLPAVIVSFGDNSGEWNSAANSCGSLNCHPGAGWYSTSAQGCVLCHNSAWNADIDPLSPVLEASHPKHVTGVGYACAECHNNYSDSGTHFDGTLNFADSVNDIISFFSGNNPDGVYNPVSLQCSDLACHGAGTPVWGGPSPGCGDCHGNPPASGAHAKHTAGSGYLCAECHFERGQGTAYHLNWMKDVNFNTALNPSGNYSQDAGTCGMLYCHGNTLSGGSNTTPDWNNPATGACGTCHDTGQSDTTPGSYISSGSHVKHISGCAYSCVKCHNDSGTGHHSSAGMPVNGEANISFDADNPSGGYIAPECSSLYCHGSALYGGTDTTPKWSDASTGACGTCHTTDPASYPADSVNHAAHLALYPGQCGFCHEGYTASSTPSNHVSFIKDVSFGYTHPQNTAGDPEYDIGTKTCINTYCHGNFPQVTYNGIEISTGNKAAVTWDNASTAVCGSCHGGSVNNFSSPTHGAHTDNNEINPYFGNNNMIESCDACHSDGADTIRTFNADSTQGTYNSAYHANFSIGNSGVNADVCFKPDNSSLASRTGPNTLVEAHTGWDGQTTTCSNSWCHGNFTNGTTIVGYNAVPDWLVPSTGACGTCHLNSHFGYNNQCSRCHVGGGGYNHKVHVDGTIGVQ